jgi:hypothetical protein
MHSKIRCDMYCAKKFRCFWAFKQTQVLCAWPRSRASMATTAALECQCIHQVRGQYSSRTQQQRGRQGGCTLQFVVGTTSGSVLLVVYRYITYSTWVCLHAIPCRRRPAQFTFFFSSVARCTPLLSSADCRLCVQHRIRAVLPRKERSSVLRASSPLAAFTSPPNPKYFLLHTSHQIFWRMHKALNVGKKDN